MSETEAGPYADPELYDLVYSWYQDDLEFYVATAKQSRGPVLELGCGTGRVLIPTLQAGVPIDGIDLHPAMLEALKQKAAALGLKARVYQADMRDFTTPRKYALITIPFRAFMHNLTTPDQLKTLRICREHVEGGGMMVFNIFHPSFDQLVVPDGQPCYERTILHPQTGLPVRIVDVAQTDRVNQVRRFTRTVELSNAQGKTADVRHYEFALRWTYKAEMELLLHLAGFSRWEILGGFDRRPLERDTDEMVVTAWKD